MKNRLAGSYTVTSNEVANHPSLSLKAKGLYLYLCSKPKDWKFSYKGMTSQLSEGEKSIRSAVRELVHYGFLLRVCKQNNGRFDGWEWIVNPTKSDIDTNEDPISAKRKNGQNRKCLLQEVPILGSAEKGKENINKNINIKVNTKESKKEKNLFSLSKNDNSKRKKSLSKSNITIPTEDIDEIYKAYPLKRDKSKAYTAIKKACVKLIKRGVNDYKGFLIEKIHVYIKNKEEWRAYKNPATWFNAESYDDEYNPTPNLNKSSMPKLDIPPVYMPPVSNSQPSPAPAFDFEQFPFGFTKGDNK